MGNNQPRRLEPGDIVQITDESHHWFPALIVVDEVKRWGCQGYMVVVESNDPNVPNGEAYIRLRSGEFEPVGRAVIVAQGESGEAT